MYSTLVITLLNTAFWFVLHFGTAELLTHLPAYFNPRSHEGSDG